MTALQGQVAIVTGAGRGIGLAIAQTLAREGARVYLAARSADQLAAEAEGIRSAGGAAVAMPTDVTVQAQVDALVADVAAREGRIDILVNNAGIGYFKPAAEMSVEEFDAMWNVNVRGVFLATRAVLPAMMRARSGAIVNIASLAAKNAFKGGTGYGATKWALRGFASSLMLEVREYNIRVVTIFPGSVNTSFSGKKEKQYIPQPEDVASAVLFSLTAPARVMLSEIDLRPTNPQ